MTAIDELSRIDIQVRPLPPSAVAEGYAEAKFRATFRDTVKLLRSELNALDATRVVLELDVRDRDIRRDGLPRADARPGPAVALSFESKHGPLRYATGEYDEWEDNVRAIALSMEALRSVDRYGVSKRGEQYAGWAQLPQSTDPADRIVTRADAEAVLERYVDHAGVAPEVALKRAMVSAHPDRGGTSTAFREVMRAKEVLGL